MRRASVATMVILFFSGFTHGEAQPASRDRALHALDRLAFGARPGDVEKIMQTGVDVWINQQLHPESIADPAVEARLAGMPTLKMSESQIVETYYVPILEMRQQRKVAAGQAAVKDSTAEDPKEVRREMRRTISPDKRPQRVIEELSAQRLIRAVDSERQLNEVMVDFWMNHFNIYAPKGLDRFLLTSYERDVIRPRIWGRFEDLLLATAKSPAMLFYLDNARSVADADHRPARGPGLAGMAGADDSTGPFLARRPRYRQADLMARAQVADPNRRRGGLNENYAREIMELHTLGVDGGYSQKDVTELARVFTGWSITRPQDGSGFVFRKNLHDAGEKNVLGVRFPAGGGMEEGETMIHLLAHHPATAHHIAYELCQRLVSDVPPQALVDRVAKRFLASNGDLRETVKAVISSAEFWDPKQRRSKVKPPFAYVVSAVRAVGAHVDDPLPLARSLTQLGEPLYGAQPPTGYSDKSEAWLNTGALMGRLNFALALAAGKMPGVHGDIVGLIPAAAAADASRSVDALALALTGGNLSDGTRATIKSRIVDRKAPEQDPWDNTQLPLVAGLILGSPEFQKQ